MHSSCPPPTHPMNGLLETLLWSSVSLEMSQSFGCLILRQQDDNCEGCQKWGRKKENIHHHIHFTAKFSLWLQPKKSNFLLNKFVSQFSIQYSHFFTTTPTASYSGMNLSWLTRNIYDSRLTDSPKEMPSMPRCQRKKCWPGDGRILDDKL